MVEEEVVLSLDSVSLEQNVENSDIEEDVSIDVIADEWEQMEDGKVAISVDASSSMSFSDWLNNTRKNASKTQKEKVIIKESSPESIVVEAKTEERVQEKGLIDKFIAEEPRLKPKLESKKSSFFNPIDMAKQSLIEDAELSTETLAKVYLDQELYDKAIQCFEYLKLKNPEKSGLFADRILAIKEQQSNKTK